MKYLFFIAALSFSLSIGLSLFTQDYASTAQPQRGQAQGAQPQMGQPQGARPQAGQAQGAQAQQADQLLNQLKAFSLPDRPITDSDIPQVKDIIQEVINKAADYIKNPPSTGGGGQMFQQAAVEQTAQNGYQSIMSGIISFKDWLTQQKCIQQVSIPYVEAPDRYSDSIFLSYPGQVPVNIAFNMADKRTAEYRLLLFVSTVDKLKFASFMENKK